MFSFGCIIILIMLDIQAKLCYYFRINHYIKPL